MSEMKSVKKSSARVGRNPKAGQYKAIKVRTRKGKERGHQRSITIRDAKLGYRVSAYEGFVSRSLVGKQLESTALIKRIREGLPMASVHRVSADLGFRNEDQILDLIGISLRTYQRRIKDNKPLDPIESDRLYRVAKIRSRAAEVFDDEGNAIDWLKTENRALGATPISLLDTEAGMEMVERVLGRIEHGVYS
jgi:putative toxin-antitoxin system antitoxin component (TIGR02293 family)